MTLSEQGHEHAEEIIDARRVCLPEAASLYDPTQTSC